MSDQQVNPNSLFLMGNLFTSRKGEHEMDTVYFLEVNSKGHAATSLPEAVELFRGFGNWREVDEAEYEQLVGITPLYQDWVDLDKVVAEVFEIAKAALDAQMEMIECTSTQNAMYMVIAPANGAR